MATKSIPTDRRKRFDEINRLIEGFGQEHLGSELTGFACELWRRVCRKRDGACMRGKAEVWAATAVHVIARMNFLFDRSQPRHLTFDTICDHFGVKKTTVGNKATQIERALRLDSHAEPGLCRAEIADKFTMVRSPDGMVMPLLMAKELGYLPPDITAADLPRMA